MSESSIPFEQQSFAPAKAAEHLGCCRITVHRLIASGKLRSFKIGRARRVSGRAILEFKGEAVQS